MYFGECVVAPAVPPKSVESMRESEYRANAVATGYLKAAGYDPAGVLDLFSRLAYDHPMWARAIVPEDLLRLRAGIEAETAPPGGYIIDSSRFVRMQVGVAGLLGHTAKTSTNASRPAPDQR